MRPWTRRLLTAATTLLLATLPLGIASPARAIEANPATIDFGTVAVGSTHQLPLQVTISAGYTAAGLSRSGFLPDVDYFRFTLGCVDPLGPTTCTATASYKPVTAGEHTANYGAAECPTGGGFCNNVGGDAIGTAIDAPLVTGVSASTANGAYKAGDVVVVTVAFDRSVVVDTSGGNPTLLLETGTTDRAATYMSGSGSDTLTFSYTVQAGDTSDDLDYTSAGALTLNGGTFNSVSYNVALPAPGQAGSLSANKALVIDTASPTAGALTLSDTHLTPGQAADVGVVFSEPITGLGLDDLTATSGTLTNLTSSDGGTTWTATLTPPAGTTSAGNTVSLDLAGVADVVGNPGTGTVSSPEYTVDTYVPPPDTTAPTSQATGPETVSAATWTVSYTATDTRSGVKSVNLYVKTPGAAEYTKVDSDSIDRDGKFTYTASDGGGEYAFYTVATDGAGNAEAAPAVPDVSTTLTTPVPDTTAPRMRPRMGAEPVRFDLSDTKALPLRVRINERASVRVKIRSGGELVRAWKWRYGVRGLVEQLWNGRVDGVRAPPGPYRVVFVAVDRAGNRAKAAVRIRVTR